MDSSLVSLAALLGLHIRMYEARLGSRLSGSPRFHAFITQVIAYMTLGIDVSRLFNEMIMVWHFTPAMQLSGETCSKLYCGVHSGGSHEGPGTEEDGLSLPVLVR